MSEPLGGFLRRQREAMSLSLRDVEASTGLSNGYLSLLERGKVKQPKPAVLYKLAEALQTSYTDLMGLAGHLTIQEDLQRGQAITAPAKPAFWGVERLSEQQCREVQNFIDFKLWESSRGRGSNRQPSSSAIADDTHDNSHSLAP
jgi:HTH-type transcriptional regulator, competence development regulator